MIELYKIVTVKYDNDACIKFHCFSLLYPD